MQLQLNRFTAARSFRSTSDFARFAKNEGALFRALQEESPNDFSTWANTMATSWQSAERAASNGSEQAEIQRTLDQHPVVPFNSPLIRHLQQSVEAGRLATARELASFLKGDKENVNAGNTKVSLIAAYAEFGAILALEGKFSRAYQSSAFEDLLTQHEQRIGEVLEADFAELEEKRESFAALVASATEEFERLRNAEAEAVSARAAQWEETHNEYIEQLQILTAVKLWRRRAKVHRTSSLEARSNAKWFGGFGLLGLLIWIFGGYAAAAWMFDDTAARIASYTAGSIATFTLYVWGLRVLIRTMLSQEHLATDASARSALAHTYLALSKQNLAQEEDRAIVLTALFAPVSDGLVKDDGMPALTPQAMAIQRLTGS
ncbi:DUF6161 domain-containing protein [Pelagerythrobacter marinus]|uniref:DUF6161 domain-containing protein n=1 Tax=Pelagerythrobacter marinus TaxID=538382 RepID=UPI002AC95725|nr:DUF6161 domain-containing protein [Pelagerythrobacter marinus]WPZ08444.1 DUF6161 domain-containing protein [Pelagerythrobacter marinus]